MKKKHTKIIQNPARVEIAPSPVKYDSKKNFWYAIIVASIGFLLYLNTIGNNYALDDLGVITGNEYVMKGFKGIPGILSVGMWHFENVNLGYYRPLSLITFAIENQFFPANPHVGHLVNILLYGLTGYLLCRLLMLIFRNRHPLFPFLVATLFIAHPIHTEVVANLKSRDEILAFLNLVIALFILETQYNRDNKKKTDSKTSWKTTAISCLFFYLALISKESAMVGIILLPLVMYYSVKGSIKECLVSAIPFACVLMLFLIQKYLVVGNAVIPIDIINYPYAFSGENFPAVFLIFFHCLRLVFIPHPLSYDYSYNQIPAGGFSNPETILGLLSLLAILAFVIINYKKKTSIWFGVMLFVVGIFPALWFVFSRGGILAERFLYTPSLGFCIVVTSVIGFKFNEIDFDLLNGKNKRYLPMLAPFVIIILLYAAKTVTRNKDWYDNLTLFSSDIKTVPNSAQVQRHYGSELINKALAEKDTTVRQKLFEEGIEHLRAALITHPQFMDAWFKIGVAYQGVKVNNDSALYYYTQAIRVEPSYAATYTNLGIMYEGQNKQELASYYYNKALEVNPYFNEGRGYLDKHRQKTGLNVHVLPLTNNMDSVLKSTPVEKRNYGFYYALGNDYASKGDYRSAADAFAQSVALKPDYQDALINLANCYGILKEYEKNIEVLNKVLALNPNNGQALGNLSVTYEMMGKKDKAMEYKERANKLHQ